MTEARRGEDGIAMITVMMIGMVMTLLLVASLSYAIASQPLSRHDQDWNAALAAAQAGVDDYVYRLQQDEFYRQWSSANPPTSPVNQAFTGWQPIPGPANEGEFHYDVSLAQFASQGVVVLTSTGRVRNAMRTIRVNLRRRNPFDYLYFTNYESLDPQSGYYADPVTADARCGRYWYAGRDGSYCTRIYFASGDVINGPLHSNDQISVSGSPTFNGAVTTAWTGTSCTPKPGYNYRWYGAGGCSDTPAFQPGDPKVASPLTLPASNSALKTLTDPSLGNTGCLYTGPTRITLKDGGSKGLMDVVSPFTLPGGNCAVGSNVPLPANGVVFVQNVPVTQSVTCPAAGNPVGFPVAGDVSSYACKDGDVFLSGTLRGQLTIAAEHNVVVVADTVYATAAPAGSDLLGLIANQFVQLYHPVDGGGTNLPDPRNPTQYFQDPKLDAAILALGHSFIVQNYDRGARLGTIRLTGTIAQQWRGPVGLIGSTGYTKNYNYDSRLQYSAPPHALDLAVSAFKVKLWAEIKTPGGLPA
jgi:hypothetical protein